MAIVTHTIPHAKARGHDYANSGLTVLRQSLKTMRY